MREAPVEAWAFRPTIRDLKKTALAAAPNLSSHPIPLTFQDSPTKTSLPPRSPPPTLQHRRPHLHLPRTPDPLPSVSRSQAQGLRARLLALAAQTSARCKPLPELLHSLDS